MYPYKKKYVYLYFIIYFHLNLGCDVGFYDKNCSKTCGLCKSGSCDIETGQCDRSGCALPGFQTPNCKGT